MKAVLITLLSVPYPSLIGKRYSFTAGLTERVFQLSHGESPASNSGFTVTFCIITELLLPLNHGA